MNQLVKICIFLLLVASQGIFAAEPAETIPQKTRPFIICTIPKSGSHMLSKLLRAISSNTLRPLNGVKEFGNDKLHFPPHESATPEHLFRLFPENSPISLAGHFNYHPLFSAYTERHKDCVKIILIRDLRDICVSTTFYINDALNDALGVKATFDQKLMYVIKGRGFLKTSHWNVKRNALLALEWMNDPTVITCRFEDLCGEQGGGSRKAQKKQILAIANAIGANLTSSDLNFLTGYLWGDTATFRKGKSGGWKEHFKPQHIKEFNKQMGKLSKQLGYPLKK